MIPSDSPNELSCLLSQQELVRPLQFTTEVKFHKDDVQQHFPEYVHSRFTIYLFLTGLPEQQLYKATPPSWRSNPTLTRRLRRRLIASLTEFDSPTSMNGR